MKKPASRSQRKKGLEMQGDGVIGWCCPKCGAALEVVCEGHGRWRVSCMENDLIIDDAAPYPCSFMDVWGASEQDAVERFKQENPRAIRPAGKAP